MEKSEGTIKKIKQGIDENQIEMLFLIRLVPAVPFVIANILPALVGVSTARFTVTTFLGIIPGTFVYTSVGNGLGAVLDQGGKPDLGIIFKAEIILPIIGLCLLAILPIIVKKIRKNKSV